MATRLLVVALYGDVDIVGQKLGLHAVRRQGLEVVGVVLRKLVGACVSRNRRDLPGLVAGARHHRRGADGMAQHGKSRAAQDRGDVGPGYHRLALIVEEPQPEWMAIDATRRVDLVKVNLGRDAGFFAETCNGACK